MSRDTENLILGSGSLYLNDVEVGWLGGEVQLSYERTGLTLSPAGSASTNLVALGQARLRASMAEFSCEGLRLAMGLGGSISASTGSPSYNPASYDAPTASTSWEGLTFGRDSLDGSSVALRFEHTKNDGKKVVVVLYTAHSASELLLGFGDAQFTVYDVEFVGAADESRSRGDQIGMVLEEI